VIYIKTLLNLGSGYLTIVAGVAAIIYGYYSQDNRLIIEGFAVLGLRRAISNQK